MALENHRGRKTNSTRMPPTIALLLHATLLVEEAGAIGGKYNKRKAVAFLFNKTLVKRSRERGNHKYEV